MLLHSAAPCGRIPQYWSFLNPNLSTQKFVFFFFLFKGRYFFLPDAHRTRKNNFSHNTTFGFGSSGQLPVLVYWCPQAVKAPWLQLPFKVQPSSPWQVWVCPVFGAEPGTIACLENRRSSNLLATAASRLHATVPKRVIYLPFFPSENKTIFCFLTNFCCCSVGFCFEFCHHMLFLNVFGLLISFIVAQFS